MLAKDSVTSFAISHHAVPFSGARGTILVLARIARRRKPYVVKPSAGACNVVTEHDVQI
jgi:hypothetical protein